MVPKSTKKNWVTAELRNLSTKKRDAWLRVRNAQTPHEREQLMAEFQSVRQLTKKAAGRARNSWWSSRAVEAERLAQRAERSGRGGSLIKELKLLGSSFPKASTAPLFSSNKTPLINDEDKLQPWSEHFASVVNSCSTVAQLILVSLPVFNPFNDPQSSLSGDDTDPLCAPLSEEEISEALFHTKSGRAPGPDGISAEILKMGGAASIQWLKDIADLVWCGNLRSTEGH